MHRKKLLITTIILAVILIAGGILAYFMKTGKFKSGADTVVAQNSADVIFAPDANKFDFDPESIQVDSRGISLKPKTISVPLKILNSYMALPWTITDSTGNVGMVSDNRAKSVEVVSDNNLSTLVSGGSGQIWFGLSRPTLPANAKNIVVNVRGDVTFFPYDSMVTPSIGLNNCTTRCNQGNASSTGYNDTNGFVAWTPDKINNNDLFVGYNIDSFVSERAVKIRELSVDISYTAFAKSASIEQLNSDLLDSGEIRTVWGGLYIRNIDAAVHSIPSGTTAAIKFCAGEDRSNLSLCSSQDIDKLTDVTSPYRVFDHGNVPIGRFGQLSLTLGGDGTSTPVMPVRYTVYLLKQSNIGISMCPDSPPKMCVNDQYNWPPISIDGQKVCFTGTCQIPPSGSICKLYDPSLESDFNSVLSTISSLLPSSVVDSQVPPLKDSVAKTITNLQNIKTFELTDADYTAYKSAISNGRPISQDLAKRIFTNSLKATIDSASSPVKQWEQLKLAAIALKYPGLVKAGMDIVSDSKATVQLSSKQFSQDSWAISQISLQPTYRGNKIGGLVTLTGQMRLGSVFTELSAGYCSCCGGQGLASGKMTGNFTQNLNIRFGTTAITVTNNSNTGQFIGLQGTF